MAELPVINSKLSSQVTVQAFIVNPETGVLESSKNFTVDRDNMTVEGRVILPPQYSRLKKWKLNEDGGFSEFIEEKSDIDIEVEKISIRESVAPEITRRIKALLNKASEEQVLRLVGSGQSFAEASLHVIEMIDRANDEFLTKVTVYIREGSFTMALAVLSKYDNSDLYDYLGNEFQSVMQESKSLLQTAIQNHY